MTAQRLYYLTRKADRAALADRLCEHLRLVECVTVTRTNETAPYWDREIRFTVSAEGVSASFGLSGDSKWGVFASWNFGWATQAGQANSLRAGRLFSPGFQSLLSASLAGRPHHKASGPFMGNSDAREGITEAHADVFAATINRAMRNVLDGSAFVQELERVR